MRLLCVSVLVVAAMPTFVRYDALPLPIDLNPRVSCEAFLALGWLGAGGLYEVTVLRFQL